MHDLRFYVLYSSISIISGRWVGDNAGGKEGGGGLMSI